MRWSRIAHPVGEIGISERFLSSIQSPRVVAERQRISLMTSPGRRAPPHRVFSAGTVGRTGKLASSTGVGAEASLKSASTGPASLEPPSGGTCTSVASAASSRCGSASAASSSSRSSRARLGSHAAMTSSRKLAMSPTGGRHPPRKTHGVWGGMAGTRGGAVPPVSPLSAISAFSTWAAGAAGLRGAVDVCMGGPPSFSGETANPRILGHAPKTNRRNQAVTAVGTRRER